MTALVKVPTDEGVQKDEGALLVRLSRIDPNPNQPRKYFNDASIHALADLIQEHGQQTAVELMTKPGEPGRFMLVGGERRWRSFQLIGRRTNTDPQVRAIIQVIKDKKELHRRAVFSNLHREDFVPLDLAASLAVFRDDGETIDGIAKMIDKSVSFVTGYLKMHELPDEVKELMHPDRPKDIQLSVTSAIDVARGVPKSEPALRIQVAKEIIERQLSTTDARLLVIQRSGKNGFQAGGRFRKPSDDYVLFKAFLGRTLLNAKRFERFDLNELYEHRPDETEDRKQDAHEIEIIIANMRLLLAKIVPKKS